VVDRPRRDVTERFVRGGIDEPTAGSAVPRGLLRVTGWAFDSGELLEAAMLVVGDGPGSPVRLGIWRPDVGSAYPGVTHAASSGFEGAVDLRAAPGGTARITLLVRLTDGNWLQAWSVEVRIEEREARPRDGARPRAAFTIVNDEPVMLPLWLAYHERCFDADDIYVLAHDCSRETTAALEGRCHVVPVHHEAAFDHLWLKTTVESFQAFLLRSYAVVLFAEVDEFVVADPRHYAGLGAYIDAMPGPAARCVGFNVVHQPDEPPLRFDAPLLAQRRSWHASLDYSKRLISRVPLRWSDGFHHEHTAPDDPPDPDLMLVHLHRVDYDWCLDRHRASAARDWNAADVVHRRGSQNRIFEPAEFEEWFRRGPDLDAPCELIPDHIRQVL
jgi:hypothetical protein